MSKEKDLLKEVLANTKAIMAHLKIRSEVSLEKKSDKASSATKPPLKKLAAKKGNK